MFILYFIDVYWSIVAAIRYYIRFCCSKVSQLHTYIYPLCFGFHSHLGHTERCIELPMLCGRLSLASYFIYSSVYTSIPLPQFIPPSPFPLWYLKFALYICDSLSALQISSSVPVF